MATPTEWLNAFQVNTGSASVGSQTQPKILGLANGGFVVAWEESADGLIGTDPGIDIVAKIFDAEGNVVREAFQLNQFANANDEDDFDLTATLDGFAITYLRTKITDPDETSVVFERFDLDGDRQVDTGSAFQIEQESAGAESLRNPQIAANLIPVNDDVFVAFDDNIGADKDISARVIDQNGNLGAKFGAAQNSADFDRLGDSAVLNNGNFVTVYEEADIPVVSLEFSIRTPSGGMVVRAGAVANEGSDPSVASLDNSEGFVVTYELDGNVFAKLFAPAGQLERTVTVASGSADQTEPVVVALPGGGFVVAWDDETNGSLLARKFLSDGMTDGDVFTVEGTNTRQTDISVTSDGRLLFAWVGTNAEVFASIWDPREPQIFTSDLTDSKSNFLSADLITTALGGSIIFAESRQLTVLGQGGDDVIFSSSDGSYFGGAGDDKISAGQFTGATDFELLDGGTGIDTLDTTQFRGNYTVNLATGETDYTGRPTVSVESFVNFENIVMSRGDDTVIGTNGNNVIDSGPGSDTIDAGDGDDTIFARSGNDIILASAGADQIFASEGRDTITTSGFDRVFGGAGNDLVIVGSGMPDLLNGGDGNDTVDTTSSAIDFNIVLKSGATGVSGLSFRQFENVLTGAGDDVIYGTDTINRISGGAGDDRIFGREGDDSLFGEDGDDTIYGDHGNDFIEGGNGNDRLYGAIGNDEIYGGDGDDVIVGKAGNDNLVGGGGNDIILGNFGNDFLTGGAGDDGLYAGAGNDNLDGSEGSDRLYGGDGDDFVFGGIGDDLLVGSEGADTLVGSDGNDILRGGNGDDFLTGLNDDDVLFGGDGDDLILGGDGNDSLWGGTGDDVLTGGARRDILHGGAGNDTFVFDDTSDSQQLSVDVIKDFEGAGSAVGDVIDLSGIDADITVAGNGDQSFTFLGVATREDGFAFGAGALWVSFFGGQTRVFALDDDDKTIDFVVWIEDGPSVSFNDYNASDFIL